MLFYDVCNKGNIQRVDIDTEKTKEKNKEMVKKGGVWVNWVLKKD